MIIIWVLLGLSVSMLLVALLKNELVYQAHMAMIGEIFDDKNHHRWEELAKRYLIEETYDEHFWHPLKWTKKQMFPGLWD